MAAEEAIVVVGALEAVIAEEAIVEVIIAESIVFEGN
jgi:hypothetical protein